MKSVGIIGAMDVEIEQLRKNIDKLEREEHRGVAFFIGQIGRVRVIVMRCGIGKVAASRGAQLMTDLYGPDIIINTGIAGGVGEGLHIGDLVVSTALVQHDFDVTGFGYPRGYCCIGGDRKRPTFFEADRVEADRLYSSAVKVAGEGSAVRGIIATGDQFICTSEKKKDIGSTFGALVAEMEGCAIAEVCYFNKVPFVVLRAVSDLADGSAPENYSEFERRAADNSARVVLDYLSSL